jgi:hypothetical protein
MESRSKRDAMRNPTISRSPNVGFFVPQSGTQNPTYETNY